MDLINLVLCDAPDELILTQLLSKKKLETEMLFDLKDYSDEECQRVMADPAVVEELVTVAANNVTKSKKPFRFSAQHDVLLFREVAAHNPFLAPAKWNLIAGNLQEIGMSVDARRCRERTTLAISYFSKEDMENLRKSETEEDYAEKEQLLQELIDLKKDATIVKKPQSTNKRKNDFDFTAVQEIRQEAMESLRTHATPSPNSSCSSMDSSYTNKKKKEADKIIDYLMEKNEKEFQFWQKELEQGQLWQKKLEQQGQLRQKELELQERQLVFEEKRYEAEKEERLKFMEMIMKKL